MLAWHFVSLYSFFFRSSGNFAINPFRFVCDIKNDTLFFVVAFVDFVFWLLHSSDWLGCLFSCHTAFSCRCFCVYASNLVVIFIQTNTTLLLASKSIWRVYWTRILLNQRPFNLNGNQITIIHAICYFSFRNLVNLRIYWCLHVQLKIFRVSDNIQITCSNFIKWLQIILLSQPTSSITVIFEIKIFCLFLLRKKQITQNKFSSKFSIIFHCNWL